MTTAVTMSTNKQRHTPSKTDTAPAIAKWMQIMIITEQSWHKFSCSYNYGYLLTAHAAFVESRRTCWQQTAQCCCHCRQPTHCRRHQCCQSRDTPVREWSTLGAGTDMSWRSTDLALSAAPCQLLRAPSECQTGSWQYQMPTYINPPITTQSHVSPARLTTQSHTCHLHVSPLSHTCHLHVSPLNHTCHLHVSPLSHTCHLHVSPLSHTRVTCTSTTTGWSVCNGTFNTGSIYIGHVQWRMIELQLWRTRNNIWIQKASAWQDLYGDNNPHSSEDLLAVQRSSEPISWCWQ